MTAETLTRDRVDPVSLGVASYARRKWTCRFGSDAFTLMLHAAAQKERTHWLGPTTGRQAGAKPFSRPRFRKPGTVSLSKRDPTAGFPLDLSRVAFLRYFRPERQRPPRGEADAGHGEVKTERPHLNWQRKNALVRRADVKRSRRQ